MVLCADKSNGHNDTNSQPGSARKPAALPPSQVAVSNSVRSSASASPLSPAVPPVADLVRMLQLFDAVHHHVSPRAEGGR
jgi:hypothetical protein